MDILNDNDDTNMEDSTNNNVDSSINNNRDGDGINHERLRALSNYADQNQDNPSWYWNLSYGGEVHPPDGWSVYRPLSNLSDLEREEIRKGDTRMVSYKDPELYEGTGIGLDWGEYYVADDEMSSIDEESSLSSFEEEAEEISDEKLKEEEKQAVSLAVNINTSQEPSAINFDQLDNNVKPCSPNLMGMPDIILEKILHYSTDYFRQPSEVCVLELVCKRIRRLTTSEDFWLRTRKIPRNAAANVWGLRMIRKYQKGAWPCIILNVLRGDGSECVAGTFRTLSADILSRMNHIGPEAHFRLRGDTIGYICELLQGFMIDRLDMAMYLAIHRLGRRAMKVVGEDGVTRCAVQRDDIKLAFQKDMFGPFFCGFSPQRPPRCNVASRVHGRGTALDCSCSLPSSSGIIWKWPIDNCHDILPPEAGRRIIRILAYQAGIVKMSNEAFALAEAELLHALGVLLVSAYESSVIMSKTTQLLGEDDELAYDEPTVSIDMFRAPPPPFQNEQLVYTLVPGQIRAAAEDRDITPSSVYGAEWVASSGFTKEEEEETERSYYYKDNKSSNEDDESEDVEGEEKSGAKQKEEPADDGNDSDTSAWSECSLVEDSELDMDDYEEDCYLAEYRFGSHDIEAHYNHFPNPNNEDVDDDNDEDMAVDNDA